MKNDTNKTITSHSLMSVAISLNAFWIINLAKTANESVKDTLDFYSPVGPLLGVFVASLVVLGLAFWVLRAAHVRISEKFAYRFYVATAILFFLMVFPPIFEPIAELFE